MEVECLIFTEIALFCVKLKVCLREGFAPADPPGRSPCAWGAEVVVWSDMPL